MHCKIFQEAVAADSVKQGSPWAELHAPRQEYKGGRVYCHFTDYLFMQLALD